MRIEVIREYEISQATHKLANQLLVESFPEYPLGRSYYKLLPQFRYFVWDNEQLIAQMSIEHRVITNSGVPTKIFGVIDLCVAASHRRQGIATELLQQIEQLGKASGIKFLILFADDDRLYLRHGYQRVENVCRWLKVDEHKTLGIGEASLADCLMVKPLATQQWKKGTVDLLGYLF